MSFKIGKQTVLESHYLEKKKREKTKFPLRAKAVCFARLPQLSYSGLSDTSRHRSW